MAQPTDQSTLSRYVNQTPSVRFVILTAGSIIILAATYAAASFLVPILLSVLFAVVFFIITLRVHWVRKGQLAG